MQITPFIFINVAFYIVSLASIIISSLEYINCFLFFVFCFERDSTFVFRFVLLDENIIVNSTPIGVTIIADMT